MKNEINYTKDVIYVNTNKENKIEDIKLYLKDCITNVYTDIAQTLIYAEYTLVEDELCSDAVSYLKKNFSSNQFYTEGDDYIGKVIFSYNSKIYNKLKEQVRANTSQPVVYADDYDIF